MRSPRRSLWVASAFAVFAVAAGVGFTVAAHITPDLLRVELQDRLEAALGSPVRVQSVGLALGLHVRVIGRGVEAFPGPGGPALRVERAVADLRPFAHLTGQRRVGRLSLEGADLKLARDAKGRWTPASLAALLDGEDRHDADTSRHPDEILGPLIVLEAGARSLLESALPAARLELHRGRIAWKGGAWEDVDVELHRRALIGDTQLHLSARLSDGRRGRGAVEIEGTRARDGSIRLAAALTELDLAAARATPFPTPGTLGALRGRLSGAAIFDAPAPGRARLELDLVGHDLETHAPGTTPELDLLAAPRTELAGTLEIDPQAVRLRGGRLHNDRVTLRLEGTVARPLQGSSQGEFSLALDEIQLEDVRRLIAWLPEVELGEAQALLANLDAGHLRKLELGGSAPLSEWPEFLAGRSPRVPLNFALLADLADVHLRSGEDHIEDLGGKLSWTGDRLEVRGLHAMLGGRALPVLDLEVDGISSFFGTDPELRRLRVTAPPLAGLGAFWKDLQPDDPDEEPEQLQVALGVAIERIEHPMFLWPIEGLAATLTPLDQGVRVEARDGTWGGVPIELTTDWLFEPEERVVAHVVAGTGIDTPEPPGGSAPQAQEPAAQEPAAPDPSWARGRLSIGAIDSTRWKQRGATARFEATGDLLRLSEMVIDLAPHGRGVANALIDLSHPESAPFQLSFEILDGDFPTLGAAIRLPPDLATGHVDVAGSVEGSFDPTAPHGAALEGLIEVDARDGTLRKKVPAAMRAALSDAVLAPISKLERIRYERMRALLELGGGRVATDVLSVDGPDARAFASGTVTIGEKPHLMDVELVLFLFRNVDRVLDKIPIVNFLLLGPNRNLLAAHYRISGSFEDPTAALVPLQSFTRGPATLVFERLPSIVERGLEALGGLVGRNRVAGPEASPRPEAEATTPRES
jgi:hypothetical protein